MAIPVIQTGFSSGELAPGVYGKVDIEAYHNGAATMRNMFVDYRSGASSRAGFAFCGPGMNTYPNPPRLIPFRFSANAAYAILLGQQFARFIYNGAYIVETAKAITGATNANPCVLLVAAHGYNTGDLIFVSGVTGMLWPSNENSGLNARFFTLTVVDANHISLVDWITGAPIDSSTWSAWAAGGSCARVYTIATPYQSADLRLIKYCQSGDVLTLTHPNYPSADLARVSDTDWTYTLDTFGSALTAPAGLSATPVGVGPGQGYVYKYCVTAYNDDTKDESVASNLVITENLALNTKSSNSRYPVNLLNWTASTGATRYNIYAQTVQVNDNALSLVSVNIWGYIGQSATNSFTDTNIAPDFSQSPPIHFNPFSASGISGVSITSPSPTADPPTLLGLIDPVVAYSGSSTSPPGFAVTLSSDGWGNLVGGGAGIAVTAPGDGLPPGGGNVTVTEMQPGPGSGLTCGFNLTFAQDPLTGDYQISNACIEAAFAGGSAYHPLLNSQMCPGSSALAFSGTAAVPASSYNATTKLGTGYLQGGAVTVRWTAGSATGYAQGNIQLLNGNAAGMSVTSSSAPASGSAPTSYSWSIAYDDMSANIVTLSGTVTAGAQGAITTETVPYASYTAPGDGYGPVPYVVSGTTHPFATSNFSAPPVATGTYTVSGTANYPGVCFYFQGRKGFAASISEPQTVWLTKPNLFQNMDYSNPSQDGDAIDITINAQDLSTIVSATPVSIGLLLLTADGAWMVTGGGLYEPVTPSSINAQPQSFSGASDLQPIRIGAEVFYVQARGYAVKRLTYSIYVSAYVPTDVSVLSSHLLEGRQVVDWAWAEQPYYLIWAVRDDGILLSMTYLQEQQIQGWARHDTQGYFRSVACIPQSPEGAS
jgi:hypothetical protein